ncbi:MAG: hypothetical protein JXA96_05605 [Sedimentisphaerales bacterium]|nr:hypothetical protein [Sedimentisphaerales bacterium]
MKYKLKILLLFVSVLFISGCSSFKTFKVKIYGSDRMTLNKQYEDFNWACRTVMHELSYKEKDENGHEKEPYYGEGAENKTVSEKSISIGTENKIVNQKSVYRKRYIKTRDDEGYEYTITTTTYNKDNPEVVLETTNPDKDKLVNLLREEFIKREFIVNQIDN